MTDPERPPSIDLDAIMTKIRKEIAERRAADPGPSNEASLLGGLSAAGSEDPLAVKLRQAAQYAEMGSALPDLGRLPAPKRLIGRRLGQALMSLTSAMRGRQTWFNRYMLAAIEQLAVAASADVGARQALQDELDRIKARVAQQEYEFRRASDQAHATSPAGHSAGKEEEGGRVADRFDILFASLLDDFRGTKEDIQLRLKVHLTPLQEAGVGTPDLPVLDIGCGRGEWLDLLRDRGWEARGVDHNPILVTACQERGLDAIEGDALEYLAALPDASLGALTAFHLVEHLPFEALMTFLDEAVRVLKTGGLLVLETPNPDNLIVAARSFWLDPTHHHPLPSKLLKALVEHRGLHRIEIIELHPADPELHFAQSPVSDALNNLFYGPQDYGLVGRKP